MDTAFETRRLFGIRYAIVDPDMAASEVIRHAQARNSFGVSALAVHGLVTAVKDDRVGAAVEAIPMVCADGQPVKWALNTFHDIELSRRVDGTTLTRKVLQGANEKGLSVFLYGSTVKTLDLLTDFIERTYPNVRIAGIHPDRFRDATPEEDQEDIRQINESGANIVLVGRGCPRQEVWVADHMGKVNASMLAVGAAFDFLAGTVKRAPAWMQQSGLEWLFRLMMEPRRLWRRNVTTNSHFLWLCARQAALSLLRRPAARQP